MTDGEEIPREQMPERVAYHEAGHAVVGSALGMRLLTVTSVWPWSTQWERGRKCEGKSDAELCVIDALAGPLAEQRKFGSHSLQGKENDERQAAAYAKDWALGDWRDYIPEVYEIVCHLWPAVNAVAKALEARGELTGSQVRDLIRENAPNRGARRRWKREGGRDLQV